MDTSTHVPAVPGPTGPAAVGRPAGSTPTGNAGQAPSVVAHRTVDSPLGSLLVAATGRGLVRVAFEIEDHARVLAQLAGWSIGRPQDAPARGDAAADRHLDAATRQLGEYFDRRREAFELVLDLRLPIGFRRRVIEELSRIPYGDTQTYGQVATAAGSPRAVRAVGTACATNPVPVVVPCHRVVRADGAVGGYLGGAAAKRALLALEAA